MTKEILAGISLYCATFSVNLSENTMSPEIAREIRDLRMQGYSWTYIVSIMCSKYPEYDEEIDGYTLVELAAETLDEDSEMWEYVHDENSISLSDYLSGVYNV